MLLYNKHVKAIIMVIFIILSLLMPTHTCEQAVKEEGKMVEANINMTYMASTNMLIILKEATTKSFSAINVAKENELSKETKEPIKLASNGKPYVYYKVYDFFYGTDKYHKLDYELQEYTYDLCIKNGIEEYYTLILCQLYYESEYKTDIVSASNDYGIAQINKSNHEWLSEELGITDFLDAKQSISCNIYMMSDYLKKYSVESSLFCYNTGSPDGSNTYSRNISYMWNSGVKKIKE